MFTIKAYLRYRKAVFAIYLAAVFFFGLIHFLSGLPMDSVCYGTVILTFLLLVWIVFDAARFHGNIRHLDRLSKNMHNLTVLASLPPAENNLLEQKYREIIAALASLLAQTKAGMEEAHAEQIDYYTMWVHQIKTPITAMRLALQSSGNVNAILEQELCKIEQSA